jgi:hypothetical protein
VIAEVIEWKFPGQEGMRTVNGVITEFPGGIPTQADQDLWTAEYLARDIGVERIDKAFPQTDVARVLFEVLFEMANEIRVLKSQPLIDKAQFKDYLKTKLPAS